MCKILTAAAIALTATTAGAQQQNCAPTDVLRSVLAENNSAAVIFEGVRPSGELFELWASEDTGKWWFFVTGGGGISCMMIGGIGYESMPAALAPQGTAL